MPELPEVETIKNVLAPHLCGRKIIEAILNRPEVIAHPSPEEFCALLKGAEINSLARRGKYFLAMLNDMTLVIHLRMTGQLLYLPHNVTIKPHTHFVLNLDDGNDLRFIDTRRFGRLWLLLPGEEDVYTGISKLGIEPDDPQLTADYLKIKLGSRRIAIKQGLLEQNIIAGIGNIYSDEILHAAKIHPARPCQEISDGEWQVLATTIPSCIKLFIKRNAISFEDYIAGEGKDYRNTPYFKVYGHSGQPCTTCGTELERIIVGGRSSVYCPHCQLRELPL